MGEYDAVSAAQRFKVLAQHIDDLIREREEDRQQLVQARDDGAAAKATVAQWNARLELEGVGATLMMRREFKQLRDKVDGLAGALDTGKLKTPPAPRWDGLGQEQEAAQLIQLRAWVNSVLLVQYPEYKFPGCWEGHRAALWELGNLATEWTRIYADPRGADLEAAMWFHERWLPGTIGRLNRAISPGGAMGCPEHSGAYGKRAAW